MPKPNPSVGTFSDGDDFSQQATVNKFNSNVIRIRDKFGHITAEDFTTSSTTFTHEGIVDLRGNLQSNVGRINGTLVDPTSVSATSNLDQVVASLGGNGGVVVIPPFSAMTITGTVDLDDDVHIVGCGPSSVINFVTDATTTSFVGFNGNAKSRWSIRNLRLNNTYQTWTGTEAAIKATDSDHVLIKDVVFGPFVGGLTKNQLHGTAIVLDGSNFVDVDGCFFNQNIESAIKLNNSTRVMIAGNHFNAVGEKAIFVTNNSSFVGILENTCEDSSEEFVRISENCSGVIVHNNVLHNCGTGGGAVGAGGSSIYIGGTASTKPVRNSILFNQMNDDPNEQRTTKRWMHFSTNASTNIAIGNFMNSTTGGLSVIQDNATATSRDGNHSTPSYFEVLSFANGGYDYVVGHSVSPIGTHDKDFQAQWNEQNLRNAALTMAETMSYGQFIGGSRKGTPVDWSLDFSMTNRGPGRTVRHAPCRYYNRTELPKGPVDLAGTEKIGLDESIARMANKGTPLTPAIIETDNTNIGTEVAAIQATYNIAQAVAGGRVTPGFPSNEDNILDPRGDQDIGRGAIRWVDAVFPTGPRKGRMSATRRNDWPPWWFWSDTSLFTNYNTMSSYPGWTGGNPYSTGIRPIGGSDPARWMEEEYMRNSILSVGVDTAVTSSQIVCHAHTKKNILDGRPTWISFHM